LVRAHRDAQHRVDTDRSGDDVFRQPIEHRVVEFRTLLEHVREQRVILRELLEVARAKPVATAVAHVTDVHLGRARRKTGRHDGRAHPLVLGLAFRDLNHVAIRLENRGRKTPRTEGDAEAVELGLIVRLSDGRAEIVSDRTRGQSARDLSRAVSSGAIGHEVEAELVRNENRVFVRRPLPAYVRVAGSEKGELGGQRRRSRGSRL
jgi:hypothetical protein